MRQFSIVTAGLLTLAALVSTGEAEAQQLRSGQIAYINSEVILQATPAVQEAQQTLGAEMQQYRTEVQEMARDLEQMIQQYQQQQLTLSPQEKERRESAIRAKQQEYEQRVEQLDQQAARRQSEVVQPVMDRINAVIETIRAERDYAVIFDVAAGAIIAADPSLDITEEVIERLEGTGTGQTSGGGRR